MFTLFSSVQFCSLHPVGQYKAICGCIFVRRPYPKENATVPAPSRSYLKRSSVSAADDQVAVEKILSGDTSAFEGIVRRWRGPLVNLAYRFCRDRGRAEEMAQEVFLRAYRALGAWRGDAAFSTWLFAVATNLYRSEIRRFPPRSISIDEVAEPVDLRIEDPLRLAEDRDRAVRRAV